MTSKILGWPRSAKRLLVFVVDLLLALVATWVAFSLRFDQPNMPQGNQWILYGLAPALAMPVFIHFGLYRAIFRYTGLAALGAIARAAVVYAALLLAAVLALQAMGYDSLPRTVAILQPILFGLLVAASRTLARLAFSDPRSGGRRLLIYGAGASGLQTAAAIASTRELVLLGFVDDDPAKIGRTINASRVYPPADLPEVVDQLGVTDILLAIPSASRQRRNAIIESLSALPVHIRTIPGMPALSTGGISVRDFQELDAEDLLSRAPVDPDPALLARNTTGHTVLVTGAAGSIGSELCRQLLRSAPARLVLLDHSEYGLYTVNAELRALADRQGIECDLVPLLGDVRMTERMVQVCRRWRPQTVYHAAAYKHVPLVEANTHEGVAVNVFGTLSMACAAMAARVRTFVLVSTDKAVRPTNVMGASKRVAELVLQALAVESAPRLPSWLGLDHAGTNETCFAMVRFGNVLDSSGSVVPLFRRQIAAGGPVTVTHPEVTRYFMTIPEAAQLVVQAGAMAQGGEVFVLDMGEPVRILDLARRMVRLSGLRVRDANHPVGDIEITLTGLRPGEKLYEELLIGDDPQPTAHARIMQAREARTEWPRLLQSLAALRAAVLAADEPALRSTLADMVPGARIPSASMPLEAQA
ncbi:MAG TPA: nucleoside-diphosphate sugar epimerase/dehydratase [Ramlibacter sp.]|jgi:FlaA1/EpsC-like NDP-sugar epimerase|uniref:polysaccharide biosynthesis protein n=1 Tax=Ramlibacter sp. TaxID=1917967 RepID=UPI002D54D9EA|nr:nucleoside-diphosphate sugar epimerase/dehydratase [Ramlibacter sp.]HZY20347.1 nucleoside-diphosphate sugar epimerase/dehydratase [Ramlibacter sp.]